MKRPNALWLVLVAMVLCAAFSYRSVHAQQQPTVKSPGTTVRVNRIYYNGPGANGQVTGQIVGFSCTTNSTGSVECFVATTE
jgi:hypothetical protein